MVLTQQRHSLRYVHANKKKQAAGQSLVAIMAATDVPVLVMTTWHSIGESHLLSPMYTMSCMLCMEFLISDYDRNTLNFEVSCMNLLICIMHIEVSGVFCRLLEIDTEISLIPVMT